MHVKYCFITVFICFYNQNTAACRLIGLPVFPGILSKVLAVFIIIFIFVMVYAVFIRIDHFIPQLHFSCCIAKINPFTVFDINFTDIAVLFFFIIDLIASDLFFCLNIQYRRCDIRLHMSVKIQSIRINRIVLRNVVYFI